MLRFRRGRSIHKFVAVQASFYYHLKVERSLSSRSTCKMNRSCRLAPTLRVIKGMLNVTEN